MVRRSTPTLYGGNDACRATVSLLGLVGNQILTLVAVRSGLVTLLGVAVRRSNQSLSQRFHFSGGDVAALGRAALPPVVASGCRKRRGTKVTRSGLLSTAHAVAGAVPSRASWRSWGREANSIHARHQEAVPAT